MYFKQYIYRFKGQHSALYQSCIRVRNSQRKHLKTGMIALPPPLRAPAVSASTNLNAESLKLAAASPRVRDDMSKTVLEMVEDMRLNEQEVVALRRAISCGDANVDGAMMVFK